MTETPNGPYLRNEIITVLIDLPPAHTEALALVDRLLNLEKSPGQEALLELQPKLVAAQEQLEKLSTRSRKGVDQCYHAKAAPAQTVPTGF